MKKNFLFLSAMFLLQTFSNAQSSQVFTTNGIAIKGYDAVAFFTDKKPVPGTEAFIYDWNGAKWLFSSKENQDSFMIAPAKYAPQYGGYCAFGTAQGHKAPTETDTWTIIDGKLYFNYNNKVKEIWSKKTADYIVLADKNWEKIKDGE